jgi:glutamate synthase (NADPH/NADH) large chain
MFDRLCNKEMVELEPYSQFNAEDTALIKKLLTNHHKYTGSTRAKAILDDFDNEIRWFVKVMPTDYRRVLEARGGLTAESKK